MFDVIVTSLPAFLLSDLGFSLLVLAFACVTMAVFFGFSFAFSATQFWYGVGVIVLLAATIFACITARGKLAAQEAVTKHNEWVAARCPVYKSQCGNTKSPFVCERRGAVVGRNTVGDLVVESYPTC